MVRFHVLGAFILSIATLALSHGAHANYLYSVERSLTCTSACSGNITVNGYLETDSLGTLSLANFTDWMLEFSSTNYLSTVLTPANSEILMIGIGGSVVATMDELTITQPGASSTDSYIFAVSDTLDFPYTVLWQFQGGDDSDPAQEIISNAPQSSSITDPFDQGVFTYPDDPLIVTLPAIIPVPAAVWLFGSGLIGLVGIARRKKAA